MSQMTWRASQELLERVRRAAERRGRSMNDYVTAVLDAATDPNLGGTEVEPARGGVERAALWRKHRLGELTASDARLLTADFEADWFGTDEEPPRFLAIALTAKVLDDAARLCTSHGLRAYGAVQLSSALAARGADETCRS